MEQSFQRRVQDGSGTQRTTSMDRESQRRRPKVSRRAIRRSGLEWRANADRTNPGASDGDGTGTIASQQKSNDARIGWNIFIFGQTPGEAGQAGGEPGLLRQFGR